MRKKAVAKAVVVVLRNNIIREGKNTTTLKLVRRVALKILPISKTPRIFHVSVLSLTF